MFFSSIKGINRLISKGMSNIYVKVTIEKNWHSRNFDFLRSKNFSLGQFWGALTHANITEFSNFLLQLKNQRSGSKTVCSFSIILILKGIMSAPTCHSFTYNLRFLYELKYNVCLSKTMCEIFHFQFHFASIKVYIVVQQNAWTLWP